MLQNPRGRRALAAGATVMGALFLPRPAAAQLLLDPQRGVLTFGAALRPILPAVARILVSGGPDVAEMSTPGPRPRLQISSTGSGVVIDAARGLLLTNHHVVHQGAEVRVALIDGRELQAEVVGTDETTDIALLRVPSEGLTAVQPGDSQTAQMGDLVFALGYPFGLPQTATMGIISGVERRASGRGGTRYIQTDAAINRGNSGGPLLDSRGRLIGINSMIFAVAGGNVGIGYAVPAHVALAVADQLLAFGEVRRGRLSIDIVSVNRELQEQLRLPRATGALIRRVQNGGAGEAVGLRAGDLVVTAAGAPVEDGEDLLTVIGLTRPGATLELQLLRGAERLTLTAKVEAAQAVAAGPRLGGAQFTALPGDHPMARYVRGVLVARVLPASDAARQGLRVGDVVTQINRRAITTPAELERSIAGLREPAALGVVRGNSDMTIMVRPQ